MGLLDFLHRKKDSTQAAGITPVLPKDIYKQGALELVDTIAPAAL